jgi:hypothetical protein
MMIFSLRARQLRDMELPRRLRPLSRLTRGADRRARDPRRGRGRRESVDVGESVEGLCD